MVQIAGGKIDSMRLTAGGILFFLFFVLPVTLYGQRRAPAPVVPESLDSVFLKTNRLRDFSVGQWVQHIRERASNPNRASLNSLLNFTTPIYFKENGLGMVSSPSFRGTTASQTAVLWNGIPINSGFNGQLDFNTVDAGSYDEIDVRSGGGSLLYGSSAIGGTVHLQTKLPFRKEFANEIYSGYGSYATWRNRYRLRVANKKWSFRLAGIQNSSSNNYKYHKTSRRNENGAYHNYTVNAALGYQINTGNTIYGYSQIYGSNRHFPIFYTSENPSKYKDFDIRALLEWESKFGQFRSNAKAAFLKEDYRYFADLKKTGYSYGKTTTFIGKYNLQYKVSNQILINGFADYRHAGGKGSDIGENSRDITALGIIYKQEILSKLRYQLGGRKEITSRYESPFLYAFGLEYKPVDFYEIKLSASKNFRRPTFNDLFWTNSGNTDLQAEQSNQVEWGNHFAIGSWMFSVTGYFNDITDMIHWIPVSGGLFEPRNEDHVQTYGMEVFVQWKKSFDQHQFVLSSTYSFTRSKDNKTGKQLIYVPYHKGTLNLNYQWKPLRVDYQLLYIGDVFLQSNNNPDYKLPGYTVSNLSGSYGLGKQQQFRIGGKIRNLFNAHYENVERYEMPGINFSIFVNLTF